MDELVKKFTSVTFYDGKKPEGYEPAQDEIMIEKHKEDAVVEDFMDILFQAHGKYNAKRKAVDHLIETHPELRAVEVGEHYDPVFNVSLQDNSNDLVRNRRRVLLNCFLAIHQAQKGHEVPTMYLLEY